MRKATLKILFAFLVIPIIFAAWPAIALADDPPGFGYTISGGNATITVYTGPGGNVAVPATLGGAPVTAIGAMAFNGCSVITAIQFPNSLKSIGQLAFQGCTGLTSLTLPSGFETVGNAAFYLCSGLQNVTIYTATSIGTEAFLNCSSLQSIYLPSNLTTLGDHVFGNCSSLQYIILPKLLTSVGVQMFDGCTALKDVELPRRITSIAMYAFNNCSNLNRMFFYGGVPSFGTGAFNGVPPSMNILYHVTQRSWVGFSSGYLQQAFCHVTLEYMNGNQPETSGVYILMDDKIQDMPSPTRPGYAFGGWYKEAACINPFDRTTEIIQNDITLYTKWTPVTCNVNFDSQSGSPVASITAPYNTTISPPANPLLTNYSFGGWYKEAACINRWNFYTDKVQGNVTLYARWLLPSQPADPFSVASASYNSIALTWSASTNATGYEIWRASSATGTFSLAGYSFTLGYTDRNLTINKSYYYKVRAFKQIDEDGQAYSTFTAVKSAKPKLPAPTGVSATRKTSRSVKVAWSSVPGATKYEVYRCLTASGTYKRIATVATNNYTNTGLVTGKRYCYKVKAYILVNRVKIYSPLSVYVSARP